MDRFMYTNILKDVMLPHAEEEMPLRWRFQQDNDPKHTSRHCKTWLQQNAIEVLDWPAQSPDLNPIENLWEIVNSKINRENCSTKGFLSLKWLKKPGQHFSSFFNLIFNIRNVENFLLCLLITKIIRRNKV